jgi:hypothetical protein
MRNPRSSRLNVWNDLNDWNYLNVTEFYAVIFGYAVIRLMGKSSTRPTTS